MADSQDPALELREEPLRALRNAAKSLKTGRVTSAFVGEETTTSSLISKAFTNHANLSYKLPWHILDVVELLSTYNPDYSQAVENLKMLANSGHELIVDAGSDLQRRQTKSFLESKARLIQERHGGIDGVIDKLMDQAAVYGAMAGEWVLSEDLSEVVDFVDINPKKIRFFWLEEEQIWAPFQKVSTLQAKEAEKSGQETIGNHVRLNELTFHYFAFDAAPNSPYGTPPFVAAIANISIQQDLIHNLGQIVKKIGLLGVIDVVIERLQREPGETEEQYVSRATSYLDDYVAATEDMVKDGGLVHFDDVEVKTTQIGGNAAGATNIHKQNEELIFSGLKSMPSVQGRCVVPETKVLTADLRWVEAGSLCVGDELVGFDEGLGKGRGSGSVARMKSSVVECNDLIELPCIKIKTDKGDITVSENHPMVAMGSRTEGRVWREAQDIQKGDRLPWFFEPWEDDRSYDAGYLAGMFDGEASLGFSGSGKNGTLTMSQKTGVVLDETVMALKRLGFESHVGEPNGGTNGGVAHVRVLGGKWETMRFLGSLRPHRLLAKSRQCWEGASLRNGGSTNQTGRQGVYANVLSVRRVGMKEVVALQTSSRTFFSEGMLSHNSYSTTETYAGVAYDIIIRNTMKYQRAAKRMVESGYWLMSALEGLRPTDVTLKFNKNRTLNRLQEEQAKSVEIRNEAYKWALGITDQMQVALALGHDEPKTAMESPPDDLISALKEITVPFDFHTGLSDEGTMEGRNGSGQQEAADRR